MDRHERLVVGRRWKRGFTLIELLIVVAIIGILASIAIQNMVLAQIRAKVSRAESEHVSLATALGAYRIDNDAFPPTPLEELDDEDSRIRRLAPLTTPIAYMSSLPLEVFGPGRKQDDRPYPYWSPGLNDAMKYSPMYYFLEQEKKLRGRWALFSRGPDKDYEAAVEEGGSGLLRSYDPSNGTSSDGDIMRFGP